MNSAKPCSKAKRAGRLSKAEQFFKAAEIIKDSIDDNDLADSLVTLCVHAGIGASDVICCAKLGRHSSGPNHRQAIQMISQIDLTLGNHLKNLLDMKGHSGYSEHASSIESRESAFISASALLASARSLTSIN
jgi:hypothetical protein